ncbi:type II toxin-antitoxin system VapC family toxin [Candidatus Micrarchaeota archaeon]|nr:type II toxin-antitoxin system VapC family toxin [Candidatus Micrarchaeota archaeon]
MNSTKSIFIDGNVLIAFLKNGDAFQKDAERILAGVEKKQFLAYASVVTLQEICVVLKKIGRSRKDISETIHCLSSIENLIFLPMNKEIVLMASDFSENFNLELSDAIIVATALRCNHTAIVTEDQDFDRVPTTLIKRVSMKNAITKSLDK